MNWIGYSIYTLIWMMLFVGCWNPNGPSGKIERQRIESWQPQTSTGEALNMESMRGEWILLYLWAGWNSTSLRQFAQLRELQKREDLKNLRFIGVELMDWQAQDTSFNLKEEPPASIQIRSFIDALPPPIQTCETIPSIWIIDPEGYIVGRYSGYIPSHHLIEELKMYQKEQEKR